MRWFFEPYHRIWDTEYGFKFFIGFEELWPLLAYSESAPRFFNNFENFIGSIFQPYEIAYI